MSQSCQTKLEHEEIQKANLNNKVFYNCSSWRIKSQDRDELRVGRKQEKYADRSKSYSESGTVRAWCKPLFLPFATSLNRGGASRTDFSNVTSSFHFLQAIQRSLPFFLMGQLKKQCHARSFTRCPIFTLTFPRMRGSDSDVLAILGCFMETLQGSRMKLRSQLVMLCPYRDVCLGLLGGLPILFLNIKYQG